MLTRRRTLAAKVEGTPGTAESLTTSEATFHVYNPSLVHDIPSVKRPQQGSFSNSSASHGPRSGRMTFRTDLLGAATVPAYAVLFQGCGMTLSSRTYSFANSLAPMTLGFYQDGMIEKLVGAGGTFTIVLTSGGQGFIDWEFVGKLAADADTALIEPTMVTTKPPRYAGNTWTFNSVSHRISATSIAAGVEVALLEDQTDATGFKYAELRDRLSTCTADPEASLVATADWYTLITGETEAALSIAVGTSANNIITLAAAKAQAVLAPTGERNKLITREVQLDLNTGFTVAYT